MTQTLRGADLLARSLARLGGEQVFTLSGNHIMPVFDAVIGTGLKLTHVRHEAAAVHMADAFARLTGQVGVALVTGGQGHTNAVAALTTAQCADAPLVLLSGHAGVSELGRGAFQELAQVDLARPVTKAAWMVPSAERFGHDLAAAMRIAASGRPGPVHLSLPVDLLEAHVTDVTGLWPDKAAAAPVVRGLSAAAAALVLQAVKAAKRPLVLAGPMLCTAVGRAALAAFEAASGVPAVGMESPRGINDPCLGAFAEVLKQADLIVLLGKPHDFTLRFAAPGVVDAGATLIVIDPEAAMLERAVREKGERVALSLLADAGPALSTLTVVAQSGAAGPAFDRGWLDAVTLAIHYRPDTWRDVRGRKGLLHPVELMAGLKPVFVRDPAAIFVADGGEIGQWAQAGVTAIRRVINGVAGSIGASIPFALAARVVEPRAPVIAVMGDGTFGFHMAEFDTAVRHGLPFVAVVGNDAKWGAEHQIQVRDYGAARAHSCDLLPTRYDQVAVALGGHGEFVDDVAQLAPAVARAIASGKPACVNVMIEGHAAPQIRRAG